MPISDLILTLIPLVLQAWLMAILAGKRLYRRLPFFAAYTVYSILAGCVRTALMGGSYSTYFYVYWVTEPLYALLGLFAMVESYMAVFRAFYVAWWFRLFLPLVALMMIGVGIAKAIHSPPVQAFQLGALILSAEIIVRYLQGGIFLLFIVLSRFFRIHAPRYPAGVLDGFGVAAIGLLVAAMFRSDFGTGFNTFFRLLPAVAYILAALIWLTSFRREEDGPGASRPGPPLTPEEMLAELRRNLEIVRRLGKHEHKRDIRVAGNGLHGADGLHRSAGAHLPFSPEKGRGHDCRLSSG